MDLICLQDVDPKDDIFTDLFFIFNVLRCLTSACCMCKGKHLGIANVVK